MEDIKHWITDYLSSLLESIIRVGVVDSTNPAKSTVRVSLADDDNLITYDLRALVHKVHQDKQYWMPDIGDHVLCLFLPHGSEQGFVLGSFYSDKDQPPVQSQDKRHVLFKDGTWLEYDRKEHNFHGHIKGKVKNLTIDEDAEINIGKNLDATVGKNVQLDVGENLNATVGKDAQLDVAVNLTANVGENAEINAGSKVKLNAPLIQILGNLSSVGPDGGTASETKKANTEHEGGYELIGNLQVDGDITATGNILADGSNSNHHSH